MDGTEAFTSAANSKLPVILLKTRSQPDDSYEKLFSQPNFNYAPIFVPVLEHKPNVNNISKLRDLLMNASWGGDQSRYSGLIFTSQRAVEAFASVLQDLEAGPDKHLTINFDVPIYTVGPATSRSLQSLISSSKALAKARVLGAETGNGEKLAQYILHHHNALYAGSAFKKPPLLFLVGEQRRDVIPKTLMSPELSEKERIQVDELAVYETGVMDSFDKDLRKALESSESEPLTCIIVVFSPSGCGAMLRVIGYIDEDAKLTDNAVQRWTKGEERHFCIATIGPTTRDYLRDGFGFEPDVCAERPSPTGVLAGVDGFLKTKGVFQGG